MKRKILFMLAILLALGLSSCQKEWQSLRKGVQTSKRNYTIKQYSGGVLIGEYTFKGMLNDSEGSDGYYFYLGDELVEVSGDFASGFIILFQRSFYLDRMEIERKLISETLAFKFTN